MAYSILLGHIGQLLYSLRPVKAICRWSLDRFEGLRIQLGSFHIDRKHLLEQDPVLSLDALEFLVDDLLLLTGWLRSMLRL